MKEKQMEDVGADYGIAGFFFLIDPLDRDRDGSGWRSEFSFGAFLFLFVFFFFTLRRFQLPTRLFTDSPGRRIDRMRPMTRPQIGSSGNYTSVCVCVCVCTSIRSLESGNDYLSMDKIRAGRPSVTLVRRFHFFFSVLAQRQYFNPQKTQHHV